MSPGRLSATCGDMGPNGGARTVRRSPRGEFSRRAEPGAGLCGAFQGGAMAAPLGGGYRRVEALGDMSYSNRSRQRTHQRSYKRRSPSHSAATRMLCRQAASFDRPLDLERWVSSLLGQLWLRRHRVPEDYCGDPLLYGGELMVGAFAKLGGTEGRTALTAVARIDHGPLGRLAGELAAPLRDVAIPDWVAQVGDAKIVRAFADSVPGSGEALLFDTDRTGDAAHMLAAFIRDQLGGIATVLRLTRRVDPFGPAVTGAGSASGKGLRLRPVDPVLACRRVLVAIERTDDAPAALIDDEDYADDRAIAVARVTRHLAER